MATRVEQKNNLNPEIQEDGLTYKEIAKILRLPVYVIKKIERDALRKLQTPSEKNKRFHKYWKINTKAEQRIDI